MNTEDNKNKDYDNESDDNYGIDDEGGNIIFICVIDYNVNNHN